MPAAPDPTLLDEHLAAENAHDLDRIMATYGPAPVLVLNGQPIEGAAAIRDFHRGFGFGGGAPGEASFSEVQLTERTRHVAATAIVVEQTLSAVHTGLWKALAPTGRRFELTVCTVYQLDDRGRIAGERVYMDLGWLERQLTHAKRRSRSASLT